MSSSHGGSLSGRLDRLIAEYEGKVSALRTVQGLLNGAAVVKKAATNGHLVSAALALDAARRQHKKTSGRTKANQQRRARSAAYLKKFDTKTPRPNGGNRGVSILIARGYLRKKGDGYIRTAKPFEV